MTKLIRVGLIGPGTIADQQLIPSLASVAGCVFWSVLSRSSERGTAFAQKHQAKSSAPAYTDLAAFLADPELDAVIIASPDKLHAAQIIAAAQAGKHVFVEKPIATNADDAAKAVAACATAGVKLAVGYHLRFHAGHQEVAKLVHSGSLGKLHHMHVRWTFKAEPSDWRASEEVGRWWSLGAVGTHAVDLVRWLMIPSCGEIEEVRCITTNSVYGGPHDESAVVALRFASGATAQIVTSVLYKSPRVIEILGESGEIHCRGTLGAHGSGLINVNGKPLDFTPTSPYAGELDNFITAVRTGSVLAVDGQQGLANVSVLERTSTK